MTPCMASLYQLMRRAFQEPDEETWQNWFDSWLDLCKAGLPITEALGLSRLSLGNSPKEQLLAEQLHRVQARLENGEALNVAFTNTEIQIPFEIQITLNCSVKTGELAETGLDHLKRWRNSNIYKQELMRSLTYPALVLVLTFLTWVFIAQTIDTGDFQNQFAWPTMTLADQLVWAGIATILASYLYRTFQSSLKLARIETLHTSIWNPEPARILALHFYAIGQEIRSGYSLLDSINPQNRNMWDECKIKPVERRLLVFCSRLHRAVTEGQRFSQAMRSSGATASMIRQAELAEQTGHLHTCFLITSKTLEARASLLQRRLKGFLGPAALILAALSIGLVYLKTLAPVYDNLGNF